MLKQIHPKRSIIAYPFAVLLILTIACCSTNQSSDKRQKNKSTKANKIFKVTSPENNQVVKQGERITLQVTNKNGITPDSTKLSIKNTPVELLRNEGGSYEFNITSPLVGKHNYKLQFFYSDSLSESNSLTLFVLPKSVPENLNYTVLRKFDHDPNAYTQGLLYKDGHIYESTGKKKQSTIRRINVETGEIVKKKALDPEFFGEGIAVVGKEIYMITYISQVGFVFDAVTFDLIRKFDLQTREGWGLTSYGDELILSDGTASLFFFDPQYFSLNRQLEVCDDKGLVGNLNELEYTPFGLFANIYGAKHIVLINEETGVVKGILDLTDLFPSDVPEDYEHVLNGIAYNHDLNTFYVTGKQWPVIYELSLELE